MNIGEVLAWVGFLAVGLPLVVLIMKATDYRKRHDDE